MTATIWLRISSMIALLFAAGHTLGGLKFWSPMGENPVLQAMRQTRFDTMGVNRSYLDFYLGFGHALSIMQLLQAVVLWQLATLARTHAPSVRPIIAVFAVAVLAIGVISWHFLFPLPSLFSLALLATLAMAYVSAR